MDIFKYLRNELAGTTVLYYSCIKITYIVWLSSLTYSVSMKIEVVYCTIVYPN